MLNKLFSIFNRKNKTHKTHKTHKTKKNIKRKSWKYKNTLTYTSKGKTYKCPRSGSLPPSQRPKGCP